ncbi:hypothetical protein LJ656_06850 [Paraburkholderia sp. MMS20-SJTR3]|uniref:Uncharacterized protein n=1 Tax=Paraburkholderia sejongensis TaxID=2886946 RepID=A0ABS8JRC9_9BURK|nr:hypothetical protein [Paraburkholderia sp. MMS20-SJTR3]MCC8392304.1 hypothetical protein [Paraburkholderia sp. MMS20-SJTR3]
MAGEFALHRCKGDRVYFQAITTRLNLTYLDLERRQPESVDFRPSGNHEDNDVAMDPNDDLPWTGSHKIAAWWAANSHRFHAGTRSSTGAPVTRELCSHVLKSEYRRRRLPVHPQLRHPALPDQGFPYRGSSAG